MNARALLACVWPLACTAVAAPEHAEIAAQLDVEAGEGPPPPAPPPPTEPGALVPIDERMASPLWLAPRSHPLWRTASSERCPSVTFGMLAPSLDRGDTLTRVAARHRALVDRAIGAEPTAVTPLRHHVGVAGLRLVAGTNHDAGCMMGWTHTHCFTTAAAVYCAGGGAEELQRLVVDLGLGPRDVERAGWFELAVVMTGTETLALAPDDPAACAGASGVLAVPPSVTIGDDGVEVRFTALQRREVWWHRVWIGADTHVRMSRTRLGRGPEDELWVD